MKLFTTIFFSLFFFLPVSWGQKKETHPHRADSLVNSILAPHPLIYIKDVASPTLHRDYIAARVEASVLIGDGDNAPFWLTNNNYGIGSLHKNSQYVRAGIFFNKELGWINDRNIRMSGAADVLVAHNMTQSNFYFHQLYADFNYRAIGLSIGAKERTSTYLNDALSSGAMTHSINSRPIPQVEIGFPNYENIPFTNNNLKIKGGLSYGKFLDDKANKKYAAGDGWYPQKVLYHRKYMFIKFDNKKAFDFIFGLDMGTQFGGDMYKGHKYSHSSPSDLDAFFKVLVPSSGGDNSPSIDQVNIVGNVYGSWHFATHYRANPKLTVKAYHEHYFDDHSGMWFKNIPDGLYGIEFMLLKFKPISNILLEYVHTKDQSGPFLWDQTPEIPVQVSAGDNYYNAYDYASASNYGFMLGNPLIISPIYNEGESLWTRNNRISALHLGISGFISDYLSYRAKATASNNWGTFVLPAKEKRYQYSSMIEVSYAKPSKRDWIISGAIAYDYSDMIGRNLGARFKVAKILSIK